MKTTNTIKRIAGLAGAALLALTPFQGRAQETNNVANAQLTQPQSNPIQTSIKGEWFNKYLFRNLVYSENPISQGTAALTYKDVSLIGIGIYDNKVRDWIEADAILDITHNFGPITASAGYAKITVPNAEGQELDSQEFYLGLTGNCPGSPTAKWVRDFGTGKGDYFELSASHQIDLTKRLSLKGTAMLHADNHYYGEQSGLRAATATLEAPIKITKDGSLTLTPKLIYQKSLRQDLKDNLVVGAGLEWKF